ncbi:hypothetical protein [Streptomyces sp. NPDC005955]
MQPVPSGLPVLLGLSAPPVPTVLSALRVLPVTAAEAAAVTVAKKIIGS